MNLVNIQLVVWSATMFDPLFTLNCLGVFIMTNNWPRESVKLDSLHPWFILVSAVTLTFPPLASQNSHCVHICWQCMLLTVALTLILDYGCE